MPSSWPPSSTRTPRPDGEDSAASSAARSEPPCVATVPPRLQGRSAWTPPPPRAGDARASVVPAERAAWRRRRRAPSRRGPTGPRPRRSCRAGPWPRGWRAAARPARSRARGSRGRGPTKPATKSSAGAVSSSAGGASWARLPPTRSTATWSPSLTASSMSWVTKTMVLPSSPCRRRNSSCSWAAHDRVDRAERLVHQHHRRVGGQRPGDADPLLLAAGELGRVALGELRGQPDPLEQLHRRGPGLLLVLAQQQRDGGDVVDDGAVREQPGVLDDVADAAAQLGLVEAAGVLVVEHDPARGRLDHPVDHPQRRRLAAAGRPDEDGDLPGRRLERQRLDGHRAVGVLLADLVEPDHPATALPWAGRAGRGAAASVPRSVGRSGWSGCSRNGRSDVRHRTRGPAAPRAASSSWASATTASPSRPTVASSIRYAGPITLSAATTPPGRRIGAATWVTSGSPDGLARGVAGRVRPGRPGRRPPRCRPAAACDRPTRRTGPGRCPRPRPRARPGRRRRGH